MCREHSDQVRVLQLQLQELKEQQEAKEQQAHAEWQMQRHELQAQLDSKDRQAYGCLPCNATKFVELSSFGAKCLQTERKVAPR